MAEPTITQDYVGHTYNYTHPTSGRLIKLCITPDMVGKPLNEVLAEADRKLASKSPFATLFDKFSTVKEPIMSTNSTTDNGLEEYYFNNGQIPEKFYRKEDVDALLTRKDAEIESLKSRVAAYNTDDPPSYKVKVSAGIRYLEDATVNGQQDISYELQEAGKEPAMPLCVRRPGNHNPANTWLWELEIDPDTGTIANWPAGTTAHVHYKVRDECGIEYFRDGVKVCDNESGKCHGYVPRFLHYSPCYDDDYIVIDIDADGRIKCWSKDWLQEWVERATTPEK